MTLYLLLTFSRTQLTVVLLWILLVSVYPLSKLECVPPLTSVMSQDLVLQQGASRLQTTSANLWTFSIIIISPSRVHSPMLNPTELRNYRVTCIILLLGLKFSVVLIRVLALVWLSLRTLLVLVCYRPLAVGTT
jgi:hypothetical protein